MNIGIVCYPTYGGSGVIATELGKHFSRQGHQVHFISYDQPARLEFFSENLFYHEVFVSDYPLFRYPPYEIALTGRIVDVALNANLDVLHVHYAIPHAAAAVAAARILEAKGKVLPIVTTLHGTDITLVGKDASYGPVVEYALQESQVVTAVSNSLRKDITDMFHTTNEVKTIPNFIDFHRFSKQRKDHFKQVISPHGERVLVHTSNFRKVKRVQDVLEVFYRVQEQIPSRLILMGDGPERHDMETRCHELGIHDKVIFMGKQDAVEEILSICDLFLLTSETESFGLAALEAMACEVPVISTNTGGIPEVNIDGVTGYTENVGDIEAMADKAIGILSSDTVLKEFKARAYTKALEFNIDDIAPLYEQAYHEAIERVKVKSLK